MISGTSLKAAAALTVGHPTQVALLELTSATTTYHRVMVDGVGVFYREAGPKDAPTIVLLHGFPSSSREFDTFIPLIATRYHLIAPDFPGFGQSDAPPPSSYVYTFDNLAKTINDLLEQLKINKYTFYLHDYGGPVGFRIISAHPERLQALIIQNANAYEEGLGAKWAGIAQYWADPKAHPEVFDAFVSLKATEQRHTLGTSHPERYNPDTWTDEYAHLSRAGQREIQADLLYDYRTNVASYPAWQAWLREHKPPILVVWGRNDPSFIAPGAEAFRRDVPDSEIHLLDAGHFALDEKNDEIASSCSRVLGQTFRLTLENHLQSELELSMTQVQVEQKSYHMPPQDGFTVAFFLTVADIERSTRFYETVFGGRILSRGDSKGAPGYIQIANTWLIVNVGGGPTPDKPSVTLGVPADPDFSQQLYEYPCCRYSRLL